MNRLYQVTREGKKLMRAYGESKFAVIAYVQGITDIPNHELNAFPLMQKKTKKNSKTN